LNAVLPEARANGAAVVVISPQLPNFLSDLKQASKLGFDLLHDAGNKVAAAFGLAMSLPDDLIAVYRKIGVDLEKFNGDTEWRLPIPARFLLDAAGIVRWAEADPDYTTRPEPEETLAALRALP
jgi:peroxiredoxin